MFEITYKLKATNRKEVREELVNVFLKELPGIEAEDGCSRYEYCVEEYDGYQIILKRPTRLNKGFDFQINIYGKEFTLKGYRRYKYPKHDDIIFSLKYVKKHYAEKYNCVKDCIEKAYRMNPRNDKTALEYAEMLAETGDTERALTVLDEIIERNPTCNKAREIAGKLRSDLA